MRDEHRYVLKGAARILIGFTVAFVLGTAARVWHKITGYDPMMEDGSD